MLNQKNRNAFASDLMPTRKTPLKSCILKASLVLQQPLVIRIADTVHCDIIDL